MVALRIMRLICFGVFFGTSYAVASNGLLIHNDKLLCLNRDSGTINVYEVATLKFLKEVEMSVHFFNGRKVKPIHLWSQGGGVYVVFDRCWGELNLRTLSVPTLYALTGNEFDVVTGRSDCLIVHQKQKLFYSKIVGNDLTTATLHPNIEGVYFNHVDCDGHNLALTLCPSDFFGTRSSLVSRRIVRLIDMKSEAVGEILFKNMTVKSVTVKDCSLYVCSDDGRILKFRGCTIQDAIDPEAEDTEEEKIFEINIQSKPSILTPMFIPIKVYATRHGDFVHGIRNDCECFYKVDFETQTINDTAQAQLHWFDGRLAKVLETPDAVYLCCVNEQGDVDLMRVNPQTGRLSVMRTFQRLGSSHESKDLKPELLFHGLKLYFYESKSSKLKSFYLTPTQDTLDSFIDDKFYLESIIHSQSISDALLTGWISKDLTKESDRIPTCAKLGAERLRFFEAVVDGDLQTLSEVSQYLEKQGDQLIISLLNEARQFMSLPYLMRKVAKSFMCFSPSVPRDELKERYGRRGAYL